ncbi:MAG: SDR family NAD(P)-dependent oxidoreductase [Acidobacteria bacterium]|nr:SDR family NAD(P)-dependent oxidoreductase [Acidobacteriota bacterium]
MDLNLRGKTAIITGASRGIGSYIARALAAEGCNLAICARGEEQLRHTADEISAAGTPVLALPLDVTEPDAAARLVAATKERFGAVDILVNNVGGNRRGAFAELSDEDWESVLELNFKAHQRCSREVIPALRAAGGGVILFIASIFGREAGGAGLAIYNATKSALISMAKIMAVELAGEGIRVLSVAPGSIRFPGGSWDKRCIEDPEGMAAFIEQNLPIGRFGTAEEIADVVAFLVSDRASLITGACINVDGGQSRSLI